MLLLRICPSGNPPSLARTHLLFLQERTGYHLLSQTLSSDWMREQLLPNGGTQALLLWLFPYFDAVDVTLLPSDSVSVKSLYFSLLPTYFLGHLLPSLTQLHLQGCSVQNLTHFSSQPDFLIKAIPESQTL